MAGGLGRAGGPRPCYRAFLAASAFFCMKSAIAFCDSGINSVWLSELLFVSFEHPTVKNENPAANPTTKLADNTKRNQRIL